MLDIRHLAFGILCTQHFKHSFEVVVPGKHTSLAPNINAPYPCSPSVEPSTKEQKGKHMNTDQRDSTDLATLHPSCDNRKGSHKASVIWSSSGRACARSFICDYATNNAGIAPSACTSVLSVTEA
ncbi:hypothetical protein AKJ16_DCAP06157 [Drosera capensis]